MRVALDTNRYVDLCKGLTRTVALLEEAEAILLLCVGSPGVCRLAELVSENGSYVNGGL